MLSAERFRGMAGKSLGLEIYISKCLVKVGCLFFAASGLCVDGMDVCSEPIGRNF